MKLWEIIFECLFFEKSIFSLFFHIILKWNVATSDSFRQTGHIYSLQKQRERENVCVHFCDNEDINLYNDMGMT